MLINDDKLFVSIEKWIDKAKNDPQKYLERQATEVFLSTISSIDLYYDQFFLKGGILMAIAYDSPRNTSDIDLSTTAKPDEQIAENIKEQLNATFPRVCAELGYPDLQCQVQSYKTRPRNNENFSNYTAPAIHLKVGYAKRGTPAYKYLQKENGGSSNVLNIDLSFAEPIGSIQIINLDNDKKIKAYSLIDLISEKFRAILQQEKRKRNRRQDVYDLASLIKKFDLDKEEKKELLSTLKEKSIAREIYPNQLSLDDEKIIGRSKQEWDSLETELEILPNFEECYGIINCFYKNLPWEE